MIHAKLEDFDKIKNIFKGYRDIFPYLRFDSLKNKIEEGKVIYDSGVVITYNRYKRNQKLGDTQAKKGDIVIQEIVKEENGNSVDVFNRFADFVQSDIWLTVRRDNQKAKRFYEKVNMKVVGEVVWSKGTLMGDVYKYSILTNNQKGDIFKTMFDRFIYLTLDKIVSLCEKAKIYLQERKLPKECRQSWLSGYKKWQKEQKK